MTKKTYSTRFNLPDPQHGSQERDNYMKRKYEVQFSTNPILNDEIEKKN